MYSLRQRGRIWYYRITDHRGKRVERKGCSDKRVTEQMAADAEATAAKIRAGYVDAKSLGYADHDRRAVVDHLADWRAFLIAKGGTEKHAALCHNRAARVVLLAKIRKPSDLTPARVQAALKAIRDEGVSLRSMHHYTRAIKGFSRWLWKDGRIREDQIAHLTSQNPDADRRHVRRALTPEEAARLVAAAESGPVLMKLCGQDRAMLYRLAMGTGFRASELASLTPESFDLTATPPTITVAAAYSKRRRDDAQPIRDDLAAVLRPWVASKAPRSPVFATSFHRAARMLREDLEAAGIDYRDGSDRVADFHALRHTYVSSLARSGAPVKAVQTLARHSTPTLTFGVYAHIGIHDTAAALDGLPETTTGTPPRPEVNELPATGTDGGHISKHLAPYLPQNEVQNGPVASLACNPVDKSMGPSGDSTDATQPLSLSHVVPSRPIQNTARERMGIEPTSDVSPRHSPVLKTVGGTSPPDAPQRGQKPISPPFWPLRQNRSTEHKNF